MHGRAVLTGAKRRAAYERRAGGGFGFGGGRAGCRRCRGGGHGGGASGADGDRAGHFGSVDSAVERVGAGLRKCAGAAPFRAGRGFGRAHRDAAVARRLGRPSDPLHAMPCCCGVTQRHDSSSPHRHLGRRPVVAVETGVDRIHRRARFRTRDSRKHRCGDPEQGHQWNVAPTQSHNLSPPFP